MCFSPNASATSYTYAMTYTKESMFWFSENWNQVDVHLYLSRLHACRPYLLSSDSRVWEAVCQYVLRMVAASRTKSQDFAASQHSEKRCQRRPRWQPGWEEKPRSNEKLTGQLDTKHCPTKGAANSKNQKGNLRAGLPIITNRLDLFNHLTQPISNAKTTTRKNPTKTRLNRIPRHG